MRKTSFVKEVKLPKIKKPRVNLPRIKQPRMPSIGFGNLSRSKRGRFDSNL